MDTVTIILYTIIAITFLLLIYAIIYNRFQSYNIRINEVESNIDNVLRNKYDFLMRLVKMMKKNVDNVTLQELNDLKDKNESSFELDRKLIKITDNIYGVVETDKKLQNNDSIRKIHIELSDNDERLTAYRNYYNDNITSYNKLVRMFPTNIIGKLSGFKEKRFYDGKDLTDEITNDLKL